MKLDERLAYLQQAAMEEARAEANTIVKKHERRLSKVQAEHKDEMSKQAKIQVRTETIRAKQKRNIEVSKEQLKLKRAYGDRQLELKKKLFEEVRAKLSDYMKTPEYLDLLVRYIEEAKDFAGEDEMTLYLNPSDAHHQEYLEKKTNTKITISHEDFIGGLRAVIRERNVLIDHAFKGSLESEFESFMFKGGAGIG